MEVFGRVTRSEFLDQTRHDYPDLAFGFDELNKMIAEIEVVGSEVVVCVHAHDGIEELRREGQAAGFRVDWEYPILQTRVADSLRVVAGRDPEIGRPYLEVELFGEEYGADGSTAAEVQDAHPGFEIHQLAQGLGQPQDIGSHHVPNCPIDVVFRRPWKIGGPERLYQVLLRAVHCQIGLKGPGPP